MRIRAELLRIKNEELRMKNGGGARGARFPFGRLEVSLREVGGFPSGGQ